MSEGCQNCPDCTAHFKLTDRVKENTKDHNKLEGEFKEHKKVIWEATNDLKDKKLSAGMFKWIAGFIILFCMGSGTAQISLISKLSDLQKDIAVLQVLLEKNNSSQEEVNVK